MEKNTNPYQSEKGRGNYVFGGMTIITFLLIQLCFVYYTCNSIFFKNVSATHTDTLVSEEGIE